MPLSSEDVQSFNEATARVLRIVERLEGRNTSYGNATLTVNAGGLGLWISATCCAIMLTVGIVCSIFAVSTIQQQNHRIERMQDYLNAIYMQAPQLRPKNVHDHHHHAAAQAAGNG